MSLERATSAVEALKAALAERIQAVHSERQSLRTLDVEALFTSARDRETFTARSQSYLKDFRAALGVPENASGKSPIADACARHGAAGQVLYTSVEEVRSLAQALAELEALNQFLAQRSLTCVRAITGHTTSPARGYGPTQNVPATAPAAPAWYSERA